MTKSFVAHLFLLTALVGCQMTPTKTTETTRRDLVQVVEKAQKPVAISENTVVLDVRPAFDFGLNKIQNSQRFPWETLAENSKTGEMLRDQRQAALRLALKGVNPQTPVVIVGKGKAGAGEEGRLAWNLLYLGFVDVQVCAIETFRHTMTPNESPQAVNEKPWTPLPRPELIVARPEFLKLARDARGRLRSHTFLIDTRSEKEYLVPKQKDFAAINIDWQQFYTEEGRPDSAIKDRLKALGIGPHDRILLMSNRGVRSAAAAYALIALGYSHVQNFAGGLQAL